MPLNLLQRGFLKNHSFQKGFLFFRNRRTNTGCALLSLATQLEVAEVDGVALKQAHDLLGEARGGGRGLRRALDAALDGV